MNHTYLFVITSFSCILSLACSPAGTDSDGTGAEATTTPNAGDPSGGETGQGESPGTTTPGNDVPSSGGTGALPVSDPEGTPSGTGGTDTGIPDDGGGTVNCTDPDVEICSDYEVSDHCGLTYEIWTDSPSACMSNTSVGFDAVWNEGNGNYLARKGVRPGSAEPVVTYSAEYNPNGNSYLGVYGWTTDPLIEYYIIDSWGSWRPPGTEVIGTVEADGGTYEIYRSERVDKPSIEGNTTFWQFWSVRTEKRTSGTITVKPHFDAWAAFGLTLGDFYEVSMLVEGYNSSGSASVSVSFH